MTSSKGVALVTGASAGIGAIYADRLAKRGYELLLVARNEDSLNASARRLTAETGRKVDVMAADLTDDRHLARVEAELRRNPAITMLVNNAGFGGVASILNANVDEMGTMIDLNVTALTRLTYAAAPGFADRKAGVIVNISSVVGVAAELLNGVYAASKAYVLAFGHALQKDLSDTGVRVQTVLPGATATAFWDVAGHPAQKESAITMSPENVVDAALAGLDAGETVTIPGLQDAADWDAWDAGRRALSSKLANAQPAPRYGLDARRAA